jgi:hypothetical protein
MGLKQIWKFELLNASGTHVRMVRGEFKPRFVGIDPLGIRCIWAELDPDAPEKMVEIAVVGTGHPFPADEFSYVGSFVDAPFVWHVYWREL